MATKICLVLTEKTIAEDIAVLERYKNYIDIVELRADYLNHSELLHLWKFPQLSCKPCILTIRRKADGGLFTGGEGARITLFARSLSNANFDSAYNFTYVDLENDFEVSGIAQAAKLFGIKIIRSIHSKTVPIDIEKTILSLKQEESDIPKLAFTTTSLHETMEVFKTLKTMKYERPYIVSIMGQYGLTSRILATKIKSEVVYTFTPEYIAQNKKEKELLDPKNLQEMYRFSEINDETQIFGIIGNDVNKSLSPQIHNTAFKKKRRNSIYIPISSGSIQEALEFADTVQAKGLSVTAPFKTEIIPNLDVVSNDAQLIGAVNTVIRNEDDQLYGYNTDIEGFKEALLEFLNIKNLYKYKVAIIGAGGAARAAARVIKSLHGRACVFNRTAEKAKTLAKQYNFKWALLDPLSIKLVSSYSDLIVQASSAGMEPNTDVDPLSFYTFTGKEKIFDLIYRPMTTKLLERAEAAGCKVCNGYKMLEYQAVYQFKSFAGEYK